MAWDELEVERLDPGIPGFEHLTKGGIPKGRLSLVAGTAGSGKTIFAAQFLAAGIERGEAGVFVTFEERPDAVTRNVRSFGWDVADWEAEGKWAFVDGAPRFSEDMSMLGEFDLSPLIARVRHAVDRTDAKRVSIDSVGALVAQFESPGPTRRAMFQLAAALEEMGVTTVLTGERSDDYGVVAQFGFEEFVSDNVIILRNALENEKRRRTIEVLKVRGGSHLKGEYLFTLLPKQGIAVVPQQRLNYDYASSATRMSWGNPELDEMCGGGLFEKSVTMVSGATGTGKSLLTNVFISGGVAAGEKTLLHSFEESRDQICRNAKAWGLDFDQMEGEDKLRIVAQAPEASSLEDHLLRVQRAIDEFQPDRVAIDSLTALQRVSTVKNFREYVLGLTFHIKANCRLGLLVTAADVESGTSLGDLHISTVSDTIVTLQYVGVGSEIRRGIAVLKMRGSNHDKRVREYEIRDDGMHILAPFRHLRGVIAGAWSSGDSIQEAELEARSP